MYKIHYLSNLNNALLLYSLEKTAHSKKTVTVTVTRLTCARVAHVHYAGMPPLSELRPVWQARRGWGVGAIKIFCTEYKLPTERRNQKKSLSVSGKNKVCTFAMSLDDKASFGCSR